MQSNSLRFAMIFSLTLVFAMLLTSTVVADAYASHPPMRDLPQASDRPLGDGPHYFVDADKGNDADPGTQAKPWQSIARGLKALKPGDTLCLRGGVYYEPVNIVIKGTADKPITLRSYPGEIAVIDAGLPDFFNTPEKAWQPANDGAPGEFISTRAYPGLEMVFGNFADSMVPLHAYRYLGDLRSTNEYWNGGGKLDPDWSIYCGPGVAYDPRTGHIHCRLAHTTLPALGPDNYRGQTDPRKLKLVVSAAPDALRLHIAEHIHLHGLVLRGARRSALHISHSVGIHVTEVTGYGSDPVVNLRGCRNVKITHSNFRGISAPWSFRSSHKYRGAAAYLLVARGDDDANRDIEIAHCQLTDSHDGPFIGTIRNLNFHHNLIDNFNDDGVYLSAMSLGGDVHIHQNTISRCLHAFSFFGEYPVGGGVWIYRNVIDLRAPVHYFQPKAPDDERFTPRGNGQRHRFPSAGRLCGDHGGPTWEPIHFYHNTVIARDAAFRNYYGLGWGGHLQKTSRHVVNNIFIQLEAWPGTTVQQENAITWHAGGNLHFGAQGDPPKPNSKQTPPATDQFTDPQLTNIPDNWQQPVNAHLKKDSPAINTGTDIPTNWPDPLREKDQGKPDRGAFPFEK